uniref:Glycosyltransferase n=2 Tax=unclassified Mycobacterium TaxID=2642494 RepID=A0A5Q5BFS2_MYCSS
MSTTAGQRDLSPIAVFAYNRPDKLAAMMTSLERCHGFSKSQVIIFVDGPKRDSDRPAVERVQNFVRQLKQPNVSWSFQDTNLGLRNSIYAGVTKVVEEFGRAIVLEDDLALSPIALRYFNDALCRYENAPRIWSVVGYAYDAPAFKKSTSTFTLPFAHPWGWATWARAWDRFDLNNRPAENNLRSQAFKSAFDMNGLYPFTAQLRNSIEGRVNSWFIHWYYTVFQNGGASVFPPRRVLDNFGLSDGSHGGSLNPYDRLVNRPPLLDAVPKFSDPNRIDFAALDDLRRCRELRVQRFIARAGSAKRMITTAR